MRIDFPDNCREERRWIAEVVFQEFLGIDVECHFGQRTGTRLSAGGRHLDLTDEFFPAVCQDWLDGPAEPLRTPRQWLVADSGLCPSLTADSVPVVFGRPGFLRQGVTGALLKVDVLGMAFFMLSRYEEAASLRHGQVRDVHGRFPASASLALRHGFLERPIVDEYVEILWAAMQTLWPGLRRKPARFAMAVTCDVDHPCHPSAASAMRLAKNVAGSLLRRRSVRFASGLVRNYFAVREGNMAHDPYYYTIDWIMEQNEKRGNRVAFYFIPEITHTVMDDTCAITNYAVVDVMRRIAARGHEIGVHPGYETYRSLERIASAKLRLQSTLDRASIRQPVNGGRQHYLRWSTVTPAIWDAAGLGYDSTLGYHDRAGFRCGTCREFTMYDVHQRRPLRLKQRPLICMEGTVFQYMGYGVTDAALEKMQQLKQAARRVNGTFNLLWHNSSLGNERARRMYQEIIG